MAKVLAKLLENEKNFDVLDSYSDGWTKGHSTQIFNLLADSYSFSGVPNIPCDVPVDKGNFNLFWTAFRSKIKEVGEPVDGKFMLLENSILREVNNKNKKLVGKTIFS